MAYSALSSSSCNHHHDQTRQGNIKLNGNSRQTDLALRGHGRTVLLHGPLALAFVLMGQTTDFRSTTLVRAEPSDGQALDLHRNLSANQAEAFSRAHKPSPCRQPLPSQFPTDTAGLGVRLACRWPAGPSLSCQGGARVSSSYAYPTPRAHSGHLTNY